MYIHPTHYEKITMETLKEFSKGFPAVSKPTNFHLYEEDGQIIFGTFQVLVSDQLILTRPEFVNYVPLKRELAFGGKESLILRPHLAIVVRVESKIVEFCKMKNGSNIATPIVSVEQINKSDLFKDGWNCLFLIEPKEENPISQLLRAMIEDKTILGFCNLEMNRKVIYN